MQLSLNNDLVFIESPFTVIKLLLHVSFEFKVFGLKGVHFFYDVLYLLFSKFDNLSGGLHFFYQEPNLLRLILYLYRLSETELILLKLNGIYLVLDSLSLC